MAEAYRHVPVLLNEVVELLQPKRNQNYIDGTVGGGGHAYAMLERTSPEGKLLGLDLDPRAIACAQERLASFGSRAVLVQKSYAELGSVIDEHPEFQDVAGMLLDCGLSSDQLQGSNRGFSFHDQGVPDMRFDPGQKQSALEMLMTWPEEDLAEMLRSYGEVSGSHRIARAIIRLRDDLRKTRAPMTVPLLVAAVLEAAPRSKPGMHPATQVFQALRIAVNHELERLQAVLPQAVDALQAGGRLAVISYHSLEDRIVKEFFQREAKDCICPSNFPVCRCGHRATLRIVTKKPVRPSEQEIAKNPRSRSARLRVVEKI